MEKKNRVIPQMFDVRPVNETGDLDLEKIKKVGARKIFRTKPDKIQKKDLLFDKKLEAKPNIWDVKTGTEKTVIIAHPKKKEALPKIKTEANPNIYDVKKFNEKDQCLRVCLKKENKESFKQQIQKELKNNWWQDEAKRQEAWEKKIRQKRIELRREEAEKQKRENKKFKLDILYDAEEMPTVCRTNYSPKDLLEIQADILLEKNRGEDLLKDGRYKEVDFGDEEDILITENENEFSWKEFLSEFKDRLSETKIFSLPKLSEFSGVSDDFRPRKPLFAFAAISSFIFLVVFGIGFFKRSLEVKESVLGTSQVAYANLMQAKDGIMQSNFQDSSFQFGEAYENFDNISQELSDLGGILVEGSRFFPYISKLSSGKYLAEAGKNISHIGILSGNVMKVLEQIKNPLENNAGDESVSFLKIFQDSNKNSQEILNLLKKTRKDLEKVNVEDIPEEQRAQFVGLKNKLPQMETFVKGFVDNGQIFSDILGGNGPRKYLFLFQNNQEMRATGGFIGSYGVMDIFNGRINNFFIDGIFNPDGQLREKVVPPEPIQKISAAWSLHDSNWFPDFPVSAEKAIWFYEKTGGPTVDGIITMTPNVMEKLLEVSGPIDMPEYEVTIDKDNFLKEVQNEVEVEYDKELNQPKKILADLAPKILDAIFNSKKVSSVVKTLDILMESLNEKQMLLYSRNYGIEKKISEEGWSGEILSTDKDYLSVINSNINGYKTDGVIEERIEHKAEIKDDGSIVDSVTISRKHNGGDTPYEWFNKVNANYMRVYVPRGSKLISAEGQTREFNSPPLDYTALKFKRDSQVEAEENSIKIDEESGTRIYDDADKTVFANWVYVSPKEEVVVKYTYLLPFKISLNENNKPSDSYSLLVQKQSGSSGSDFISDITYPQNFDLIWRYPEGSTSEPGEDGKTKIKNKTNLKKDKFMGAVFQ